MNVKAWMNGPMPAHPKRSLKGTQALFEAIRKASLPAVWSQGVKLARADAVSEAQASPKDT